MPDTLFDQTHLTATAEGLTFKNMEKSFYFFHFLEKSNNELGA